MTTSTDGKSHMVHAAAGALAASTAITDHAATAAAAADAAGFAPREGRMRRDRRHRPTPMLSRYMLFGGRRAAIRRSEEREGSFVDVHGPVVLLVVLSIVALNLLDAFYTLLFLSHGGQELNPIVQVVLDSTWHPWPFLLMKTVGIGIAAAFLMTAKFFRPARFGMGVVLVGYGTLLGWHFYLCQYLPY
ncbi:MAG: DUF5658 family protein [Planctomycetota bacterium]